MAPGSTSCRRTRRAVLLGSRVYKIIPAGPEKLLNETHIAETHVGANEFLRAEWRDRGRRSDPAYQSDRPTAQPLRCYLMNQGHYAVPSNVSSISARCGSGPPGTNRNTARPVPGRGATSPTDRAGLPAGRSSIACTNLRPRARLSPLRGSGSRRGASTIVCSDAPIREFLSALVQTGREGARRGAGQKAYHPPATPLTRNSLHLI